MLIPKPSCRRCERHALTSRARWLVPSCPPPGAAPGQLLAQRVVLERDVIAARLAAKRGAGGKLGRNVRAREDRKGQLRALRFAEGDVDLRSALRPRPGERP